MRPVNILFRPRYEWKKVETEKTTTLQLYLLYIMPMTAIGPLAVTIGYLIYIMTRPSYGFEMGLPWFRAFVLPGLVVGYALDLFATYIWAVFVNLLAPPFSGEKNQTQALKVVAYASTAFWLGGILLVIPISPLNKGMVILSALYSVYLLYLGLPVLMRVSPEKASLYTGEVVIMVLTISVIFLFVRKGVVDLWPEARVYIQHNIGIIQFILLVGIIAVLAIWLGKPEKISPP
jgi:hypothetical protein